MQDPLFLVPLAIPACLPLLDKIQRQPSDKE